MFDFTPSPALLTLFATACAGFGSVLLAALVLKYLRRANTDFLLSFAAGALLCTAFTHLLPEAVEAVAEGAGAHTLFTTLFLALLAFFLLDKAELYHHGHEHHGGEAHEHGQPHEHGHSHGHSHGKGGLSLLLGDAVHCLGDGMLIAAACLSSPTLGLLVALAVFAHEVPHHMGDLVVLQGRQNLRPALLKLLSAGSATLLGGLIGYLFFSQMAGWMPYLLMVAAGSFIYVALADLIPQLQRHWGARDTVQQVLGLALGAGLVLAATHLVAEHAH
ncbi:MAG: ZIP family metal transporter [Brachymonas sp.]|jgi:zinc and cadmium transporter